jgi:hypothetical protein
MLVFLPHPLYRRQMDTLNKYIIGGIIVAILAVAGIFLYSSGYATPTHSELGSPIPTPLPSASPIPQVPSISHLQVTPRPGWYKHPMNDSFVIYTRQQKAPLITPDTEAFAIGEYISISAMIRNESMEDWVTMYASDDVMILSKSWSTLNGYQLLKVEQEAGGADGKTLNYYLFIDNRIYSFQLYPLETNNGNTTVRNQQGIATLEQIRDGYTDKLK